MSMSMSKRADDLILPSATRNLRACMVCSIVLNQNQFLEQGCPNCEDFVALRGSPDNVRECTSQVFEGVQVIRDTKSSWVARWQRLDGYKPGSYAVKVVGILPDEVLDSMEAAGVKYIPRDGSNRDEET